MRLLKQQTKPYILLLPSLLFIVVFLGYGGSQVIFESFQSSDGGAWTTANYSELLKSNVFWDSFFLTVRIALISTILSLALGLFFTRAIYFYLPMSWFKGLVWLPMLIPHFVAAYLVLLFFSQSGLVSSLFVRLNLISEFHQFPILTNDSFGIGIILSYVWKEIPFVILVLLPIYHRINKQYFEVVRTLGGGKWERFKTVEWPAIYPVLAEIGIILFAFIISAYEIPFLLGVTYPKAMPILGYDWFFAGDWSNRPKSMALFALLSLFILGIAYLVSRFTGNKRFKGTRGR